MLKYSYEASKGNAKYKRVNTRYDLDKLINMLSEGYDSFTVTNENGDVVAEYPDKGNVDNTPKKKVTKKKKLKVVEPVVDDFVETPVVHAEEVKPFSEEELNELANEAISKWDEEENVISEDKEEVSTDKPE